MIPTPRASHDNPWKQYQAKMIEAAAPNSIRSLWLAIAVIPIALEVP
jgi:hypothetical protein